MLTDEAGCTISATLPEHGVTIERRTDFPRSAYPLWTPYGAPPDGAYLAEQVKISVDWATNCLADILRAYF